MKSQLYMMSYRALSIAMVILLAITDISWAADEKVDADVPFFFEMERARTRQATGSWPAAHVDTLNSLSGPWT